MHRHSIKMLGLSSIIKLRTLFKGACASQRPPSLSRCSFSDRFSSCSCDSSHISLGMTITLQNTCTTGRKTPVKVKLLAVGFDVALVCVQ